ETASNDAKDFLAKKNELEKAKKTVDDLVKGMKGALAELKLFPADKDLDLPAFKKVVNDYNESKTMLAAVNEKLKDAKIDETGEKGLEKLLTSLKGVEEKLKDVNKTLEKADIKAPGAKGVEELIASRGKLLKERQVLDAAIQEAFKQLVAAKVVPPDGDPAKQIISGAKMARIRIESPLVIPLSQVTSTLSDIGAGAVQMVQRGFENAGARAELLFYRTREPLIQPPERKLDTWLTLLQDRGYTGAKQLAGAIKEADWVRSAGAKADAESRAKALAVSGLALRNQRKYDEARAALAEAVKEAGDLKDAGDWTKLAAQALAELTDARAY